MEEKKSKQTISAGIKIGIWLSEHSQVSFLSHNFEIIIAPFKHTQHCRTMTNAMNFNNKTYAPFNLMVLNVCNAKNALNMLSQLLIILFIIRSTINFTLSADRLIQ